MHVAASCGILFSCLVLGVFVQGCAVRGLRPLRPVVIRNWDDPSGWELTTDGATQADVIKARTPHGSGMQITYSLREGEHGFLQLKHAILDPESEDTPITFLIKASGTGDLEVKFIDGDGSTFGAIIPLQDRLADWTRVTAYRKDLEYMWGGDRDYAGLKEFHIAISGQGSGTVLLADIGFGSRSLPTSFTRDAAAARPSGPFFVPRRGPQIDPDSDLPGIGFRQRRASEMVPEDPLVLEWLKTLQDVSSPGGRVLPTTEDNQLQTFNNALVAMAFILKGERERAERILDFFAGATDRKNTDPTRQNFFLNGEARGFYQDVALNPEGDVAAFHDRRGADRWMGDMAWLLTAYKYYDQQYGAGRYAEIEGLLRDLLVSWFKDDPSVPGGGYVQHGWRKGDTKLHEDGGHPEGNIDCYALFKLLGDEERARKIRTWLDHNLRSDSDPLDLYTWRVLAYDGERGDLLDIPDHDLRYRKTVTVSGRMAAGPFGVADAAITNIWLDGLGHIACAFQAAGNRERGWFYANQYDAFLMDSTLGGRQTKTLPYTANEQGGFHFDQSKGYISVAAWYIFAKNAFNPMRLKKSAR